MPRESLCQLPKNTIDLPAFRMFQGKILEEYDRMVDEFGFTVIDASRSIIRQQHEMRRIITPHLKGLKSF